MSTRRDYKRTATGQRRRQTVRRHGLLVITLILIGLFGGLLAYIKGDRAQPAPTTAMAPAPPPAPPPATPSAPLVEPVPAKPKYDFYTELPKRQIDIQREETRPPNAAPSSPVRTQPAVDPLRKPAAPRQNTTPTVASPTATAGTKPNSVSNSVPPVTAKPAQTHQKITQPLARGPATIVKTP